MQRAVPSSCSLQTISEEPSLAHENQLTRSCVPLPVNLASNSKEWSAPGPSQAPGSDEREPSGQLTQEDTVWEKMSPAARASEQEEEMRESSREGGVWKRVPGNGSYLHSQAQHNQALDNGGLSSAGNGQKPSEGMVQELRRMEKTRDAVEQQLHPSQMEKRPALPLPPDSPQVTQTITVPLPQVVMRRSKSEGCKLLAGSLSMKHPDHVSPVAEVYSDATIHDRLWSKLDFFSQRDSMSSSSSMSSNDTVIDLSLPNLARKSLPDLGVQQEDIRERRAARPWSANAVSGREIPTVTKSKSNPNLRPGQSLEDDLCPRLLSRDLELRLSSQSRRPSWNHLYMESLKRSSLKSKDQEKAESNHARSKSLGDLTSDDIKCCFDSKYHSITRTFVTPRLKREQHHLVALRSSSARPPDELTERLRRLTTFQQENDITSPTCLQPVESEEDEEGMVLLRRSSSRSQSRVRYIANRAKQAQERQKLKSLALSKGRPIEERGNPEGACSFSGGAGIDSGAPALFTPQLENPADLNPNTEVVFMFKL